MASFRNLLGLPVKDWDNRASGQVLQLSSDKEHWEFGAGGGGGTASPLTTKGDLYGYDTDNARLPVGTDGQVLVADSTKALGVKWAEGNGIHIDDRVSTYANLPSPPTEGTGATYLVKDGGSYPDNLLYVWNGTSWDAEGEGAPIVASNEAHHAWRILITDWWIDPNSTRSYVSLQELLFAGTTNDWAAQPFGDSNLNSDFDPANAFNHKLQPHSSTSPGLVWISADNQNDHYIGQIWPFRVSLVKVIIWARNYTPGLSINGPRDFILQYSDDTSDGNDGTWADAATVTGIPVWVPGDVRAFDIT